MSNTLSWNIYIVLKYSKLWSLEYEGHHHIQCQTTLATHLFRERDAVLVSLLSIGKLTLA